MPLGGWWGDVLFRVKEDATAAVGAGAGDSVEIEHVVQDWRKKHQHMRERVRDRARVLYFAVFYLYLRHTAAHGNKDLGRNGGEGWSECVCACVVCNVGINDL